MAMNPRLLRPLASGFNPRQIAGLGAWYDASVASSLTLASGFVSQWDDLSGGGLHLTQSVEASRPGTGTIGGKVAVDFDAFNDYLSNANAPTGWLYGSVFCVHVLDVTNIGQTLVNIGAAGGNERMGVLYSSTGEYRTQSINSAANQTGRSGGTAIAGAARLLRYTFDGASAATLAFDGTPVSGTTVTTTSNESGVIVGIRRISGASTLPLNGRIGEILIYNRVLTASEIAKAEGYLAWKWGVTLA